MNINVIKEDKNGVLVELSETEKSFPCLTCKYGSFEVCPNEIEQVCTSGRYLTQIEEQEYYSSQRV